MKKLLCLLCIFTVMISNISVFANIAETKEVNNWVDRYTGMEFTDYVRCEGSTEITGKIGDTKIALDTSNQKFFSVLSESIEQELNGTYDYKIQGGKLKAGINKITLYFDSDDSSVSALLNTTLTLTKDSQKAPEKSEIQVASKGKTWIKLKKVAGCQYKVSGGSWQSSNKITGLKAGKEYKVYIRKKATATKNASKAVSKTVKTKSK